jgi:hypothetical protein
MAIDVILGQSFGESLSDKYFISPNYRISTNYWQFLAMGVIHREHRRGQVARVRGIGAVDTAPIFGAIGLLPNDPADSIV